MLHDRERLESLDKGGSETARVFEGRWRLAWSACVVHALHIAVIYMGPSTLISPMRKDMGLSVEEAARPLNVMRALNGLFLVPSGAILDRARPQRVLLPNMCVVAVFGAIMPLSQSLMHLITVQVAFAGTKLFGGLTPMVMLVAEAFPRKSTGTPTALVLGGWSIAGFVAPAISAAVAERYGWRYAFAALAILFIVIAMPLAVLYLSPAALPPIKTRVSLASGEFAETLLPSRYLASLGMMGSLTISIHVIMDHFIIYLTEDVGIALWRSAMLMSTLNVVGLFGKVVAGALSDRIGRSALMFMFGAVGLLSSLMLVYPTMSGTLVLQKSKSSLLAFSVLRTLSANK